MFNARLRQVLLIFSVIALLGGFAIADDNIQTGVSNVSPTAVVTPNGQGSYSPGQISILYTVVAPKFSAGDLGSFTLNLKDVQASSHGQFPNYPAVNLTVLQTGSENVILTPVSSTLGPVTGPGWTGSTVVNISIPEKVVNDPAYAVDGTTLVGNLQVDASDSKLGTNTSVQVKIKLVVPKNTACLNVYNFTTTTDFSEMLSSVVVNSQKKTSTVRSAEPGQISNNTLVVNTCGVSENFDVLVALDPHWETNPAGNPGNAVFTYNTNGEIDTTTFNISAFGSGTPQGQSLCVPNVSLSAGDTFLMTVHSGIITGVPTSTLGSSPFVFNAGLYTAGTGCAGAVEPLATPNPAGSSLAFTLK